MDYHQFFHDSLKIILIPFQEYLPKDHINTLKKKYEHIIKSNKSIYVEIFAFSNGNKTKIQQWKFKPKGQSNQVHLQRSYSNQNSNDDSELSFSQLNEPSFFKTLQNIRKSIQPKLLFKRIQRPKVICQIKDNQQQLITFSSGNTFYFQVAEYQNQLFQVKLSFKYNYEDQVVAQEMHQIKAIKESDSDQFQLLIDQSYENRITKQGTLKSQNKFRQSNKENVTEPIITSPVNQHQRKMSEGVPSNKFLSSPKQQMPQSQKILKLKRQQQFQQIQRLLKNIDFTTVQSTRLQTFLEYLL